MILQKQRDGVRSTLLAKDNKMQPMFFKPAERSGQKLTGEAFQWGRTSAPVLKNTPAFVERRLVTTVEEGDHSII